MERGERRRNGGKREVEESGIICNEAIKNYKV